MVVLGEATSSELSVTGCNPFKAEVKKNNEIRHFSPYLSVTIEGHYSVESVTIEGQDSVGSVTTFHSASRVDSWRN